MISDKYKCIFIHIPKNAGTSIESKICAEEELVNLLPDHRTILDMEPLSPQKIFFSYHYDQGVSIARRAKYYLVRKKLGSFINQPASSVMSTISNLQLFETLGHGPIRGTEM